MYLISSYNDDHQLSFSVKIAILDMLEIVFVIVFDKTFNTLGYQLFAFQYLLLIHSLDPYEGRQNARPVWINLFDTLIESHDQLS